MTSTLASGPTLVNNVHNGPHGPSSYTLGSGALSAAYGYDSVGRLNSGTLSGAAAYTFSTVWSGTLLKSSTDSVLNQSSSYSYDEFNRLKTATLGTTQTLTNTYDRYGNRWQSTATPTGPNWSLSYSPTNNQITTYAYDAAGNMTYDGVHHYTYDAEGNMTAVDSGSTATYLYDALNHRVRSVVGSGTTEYVFNASGQRVSEWNGTTRTQLKGKYY